MLEILPFNSSVAPKFAQIVHANVISRLNASVRTSHWSITARYKSTVSLLTVVIALICLLPTSTILGQLSGNKSVPGDYANLEAAISALNTQGVGAGGVTFNVTAAQTAPLGGYVIGGVGSAVLSTASMANPIVIEGNANTVTSPTPQTAGNLNDGIFKLIGADWTTISGWVMLENAANTTTTVASNNMTEWGVALLYVSTTDGAQNNTIESNTINLDRTYQNTFGIYSNSTHTDAAVLTSVTATGATGGNHGLRIYGNTITDVNMGIVVVGPTAAADNNDVLEIGGTEANANDINNYGTTATFSAYANVSATVNGILVRNTKNFNISENSVASSEGGTTSGTLRGIFVPAFSAAPTGTITNTISNNSISVRNGSAAGIIQGIAVEATTVSATTTLNINRNDFHTFGHTVAGTAAITFISAIAAALNVNINENTFTNITVNTTGSVTFINKSVTHPASSVLNVNDNSIVTAFSKTGAGGTVQFYESFSTTTSTATESNSGNNFSNVTLTGATTLTAWRSGDGPTGTPFGPLKTVANNTFSNLTLGTSASTILTVTLGSTAGTSTISGNTISNVSCGAGIIALTTGTTSGGSHNWFSNTINGISTTGAAIVSGIAFNGTSATQNVFKNKVYDLSGNNAGSVINGILISTIPATGNFYNNLIGDLRNTAASGTDVVRGIAITGTTATTTLNVSYNTILINASTSGANFGTTGILHTTSTTATSSALNLRNNIIVNTSTAAGTGLTVAYRRSSTTLTNYGSVSDRNLFYAGTPSATNLIFYDGTNSDQMMSTYQVRVTPRDASSLTENPPFISTSGASADFLHINTSAPTQIESAGINIVDITDDFDAVVRQGNGGYSGTGSAPDIGADEGEFMLADLTDPAIAFTPLSFTCATGNRSLNGVTISDASGVPIVGANQARIYYKKDLSGTWTSSQGSLAGGTAVNGTWNFTMVAANMGGLAAGDTVYYYVIAQDNATPLNVGSNPSAGLVATNVNTVTTPPTAPQSFVVSAAISGTFNVGTGQTYTTLTQAINVYNTSCLAGPVVFQLTDATYGVSETFPIVILQNPDASSTNTLTIRPAAGTAVTISGTSGAVVSALIQLSGADYTTFDGLNTGGASLTIENTSTTGGTATLWLTSSGLNAGARNNTIRNVSIKAGVSQNAAITVTYGIVISGNTLSATATSITAGDDNDNNTIEGNTFTKVRYAVLTRGGSTANPNTGTIITGNTFGPSAFGTESIGKGGIVVREEDGVQITDNTLQFIGGDFANTSGGTDRVAIALGTDAAWPVTSAYIKNALVTGNVIHDIIEERLFAAAAIAIGGADGTNATNNLIANNMIYQIKSNGTGTDQTVAIGASAGNGDKIVYNSIFLTGDTDANASAGTPTQSGYGISFSSTSVTNPIVLNNIVHMDLSSSSAPALKNATINVPTAFVWGTGSSNYNNFYINPSNTQSNTGSVGGTGGTYYLDLASWQAALVQDINSSNYAPVFTSATDLHLVPASSGALNGSGIPVAGVTIDFDGDSRNVTTPDIGADEFSTPLGNDVGVIALVSPVNDGCYSSTEMVVVTLRNFNTQTLNFAVNNVTVTVTTNTGYNSNVVISTGTLAGGATQNVMLPATINMSANGTYTFNGNATVAADLYNGNDAMSAASRVHLSLGGSYDVGAGGDYTTLTAAITAYNTMTCCTGPIIFSLTDATYGAETFPIVINHSVVAGSNGLTITPEAGEAVVISGTSSTGALIDLSGADYVTIDGVNSGGSSLIIRNTSTTIPVIRFINEAISNTLISATFEGAVTSTTSGVILFSTSATGLLGNSNNTITSCDIRDRSDVVGVPGNGIYSSGTAANLNLNNVISNNDIFNFNSSGVNIATTGNGGWQVLDNNIYNAQATPSALTQNGVLVAGGINNVVSGNFIGGSASGATGTWTNSGNVVITGIALTGGVTTVQNNTIANFSATNTGTTLRLRGITHTSLADGIVIDNNQIFNLACFGSVTSYAAGTQPVAGIYTNPSGVFQIFTISNNEIHDISIENTTALTTTTLACGMALTNFVGECFNNRIYNIRNKTTGTTAGQPPVACGIYARFYSQTLVYNNMISLGDGESNNVQYSGVVIVGAGTAGNDQFYLHNSIRITGTATGTFSSYAFVRGDNSTTSPTHPVTIANNIISMERTGGGSANFAIASQGTTPTGFVSNFNDLYSAEVANLGYWNATGYNFANWQSNSAGDANSVNVLPVFTSVTDLHVTPANAALNNAGTPIEEVEFDYDDQPRNILTPDLGADEFVAMGECSPIVTNISNSGAGSLRDVIACVPTGTSITFDPSLFGQTIALTSGEIVLNKSIGLYGLGKTNLTISGNNTSRIFHLQTGNMLRLTDIALKNGSAATNGGAIFVQGNLRLNTVLFENNQENGVDKSMTLIGPATMEVLGDVDVND